MKHRNNRDLSNFKNYNKEFYRNEDDWDDDDWDDDDDILDDAIDEAETEDDAPDSTTNWWDTITDKINDVADITDKGVSIYNKYKSGKIVDADGNVLEPGDETVLEKPNYKKYFIIGGIAVTALIVLLLVTKKSSKK